MRVLILFTLLLCSCASAPVHLDNGMNDYATFRLPASDIDCAKIVNTLIDKSKTTALSTSKNNQKVISLEGAETIKTYIFQGPILNFYLRNKKIQRMM